MINLTYFQITWLLLFFIPIVLTLLDERMLMVPVLFVIFEVWRSWSNLSGGEWVPTPQSIVEEMLNIADLGKDDVVYDLGSGDGKIVLSAARRGANAIGVEIDPIRVLISKIKIKLFGLESKARIELGNLYKANVKDASVITLFLLPKTMLKLENKLRKELKKGSRVVSYRFTFKNWKPVKIDKGSKIYLYRV